MTWPGIALEMASQRDGQRFTAGHPVGWLPLILLPAAVLISGRLLAPWALMWGLAIAIYGALKWMTWWRGRGIVVQVSRRRSLAYLWLWPGMDAPTFLDVRRTPTPATRAELLRAVATTLLGLFLLFGAVRVVPSSLPLVAGWIGLFSLIFILHFGSFRLVSIWWRWQGIEAVPIMRAPVAAASLSEFWGARWNTAFHVLARDYVVRPLRRRIGVPAAMLVAFVGSGLVHDLVISVPAGAGYGLPTAYFCLQGLALLLERAPAGQRLGLGRGLRGRLFAIAVTALPAFWLFHPAFVVNVVVPFLRVLGAR
jgi:alginate O-acetyltransferase complex protein AlgI